MLNLIVCSIVVVATISGEVVETNKDVVQENVNVPNVEQKSNFPYTGSIQQKSINGIVNFPPFKRVHSPSANSDINTSGINNPIKFLPYNGIISPFFNSYNPSLNCIINPFYNGFYNYFPLHNGVFPSYSNGIVPSYFNGLIPIYFCNPSEVFPPYYNPIYPAFYPYLSNTGEASHIDGAAFDSEPKQVNNNVEAVVDQNVAHIEQKPEILSSISETVSETLPHGESVVKETKEFSTNLNDDFHSQHGPAVVKTVSQIISKNLPHVEKVVKETKEFITHGDRNFHGHGYGHHHGDY